MAPFCKEDKILIKSLYECKGYNTRQFITEFPDKAYYTSHCFQLSQLHQQPVHAVVRPTFMIKVGRVIFVTSGDAI